MSAPRPVALVAAADLLVRVRLQEAASAAGFEPRGLPRVDAPLDPEAEPALIALDLDDPAALDALRAWRERWPAVRIVGFVSHVDRERQDAAERLGCEVHPRGAAAANGAEILGGEGQRAGTGRA